MTATYTPLGNITLGTTASSITFSSIPATYRDLVISFQGNGSTTLQGRIRLNGDTGGNYTSHRMSGDGSSATVGQTVGDTSAFGSNIATASTTSALQMNINIMDYSSTNKFKTFLVRATNAATATEALVSQFASTSAITSVTILTSTGNWAIGTTASLYGIVS
jgi:hypothetical protein